MLTAAVFLIVFSGGLNFINAHQHIVNSTAGIFLGDAGATSSVHGTIVVKFLGIPYAEAPVNERRFAKPIMKERIREQYNATKYGPSCIQDVTLLKVNSGISENCLFLNIFTTMEALKGKLKTVMVWIHGGAFVGGNSDLYDSTNLARFGDVVVVTLNYRLGIFGFIGSRKYNLFGNYGLWDQQLALQWVHQYIEDFGGDKNKVTIFGQSAGAASVTYQATYDGNVGLFQRAISESGIMSSGWAYNKKVPNYTDAVVKKLNCSFKDIQKVLTCLRNKTATDINSASYSIPPDMSDLNPPFFAPIQDDEFVKYDPATIFNQPFKYDLKPFKNLDILMGINNLDGLAAMKIIRMESILHFGTDPFQHGVSRSWFEEMYIPLVAQSLNRPSNMDDLLTKLIIYRYSNHANPSSDIVRLKSFIDMYTDNFFVVPTIAGALCHFAIGNKTSTYIYEYTHQSPSEKLPPGLAGADHGDELPYVFGFTSSRPHGVNSTVKTFPSAEKILSEEMMKYWTNFAKFGNPNGQSNADKNILPTVWPEFNNHTMEFLEFGSQKSVKSSEHLRADNVAFWMDLLPSISIPESKDKHCPSVYSSAGVTRYSVWMMLVFSMCLLLWQKQWN